MTGSGYDGEKGCQGEGTAVRGYDREQGEALTGRGYDREKGCQKEDKAEMG